MKKILVNISLAMLAVGGMTSCSDILDKEVDLTYTDENIYSNYDRTRGVLANAYTYLPDAFAGYTDGQFRAASRDCMTDNALSYWNVHYYHSVLNDSYDAKNHWFANSYWSNDLKGIRVCNDFISKARESVIGNAEKSGDDNKLCDRYKAEARFIRAILHFDMIGYFGAVDVSVGGKDYQDLHGGTTTGYYSKKFVHNMSFKNPTTYVTACPIFRYAEILLNAAEALNEAKGPEAAYDYVNQVRARVGMPAYKGMTKEQLRERIRNERRIELAFEDHRFFDERRWKLFDGKSAATEKSEPRYKQVYNIYSVVVTPNESQVYTYRNDNTHPTRAFSIPKNYYFPVPDDTYKKNPNLGQNAGWELSDAPKKDDTTEGGETTEGETTGK
jgi:hypothetical protein